MGVGIAATEEGLVVYKFNPRHDAKGRFASGGGGAAMVGATRLGSAEKYAIEDYTSDRFLGVNRALRGQSELGKSDETLVRHLDAALGKLPTHEGTVYRMVDLGSERLASAYANAHEVGGRVGYRQYLSTSARSDIHGAELGGRTRVLLTIQGKSGRDISKWSNNPGEKEVLFPRNATFTVRSVSSGPHGSTHVALQED